MAREQRKLAAILAADVVGYSRLMGRDESGTLTRLRGHRKQRFEPVLARHGGRLVKLTGDGALAEFPSAVDALSAAIEFQQLMAEVNRTEPHDTAIVFRIGLHLGDLIVDGDDLYGDGVNVAARLEAEAPPGGILISGNIHDAVVGRLKATVEDLGRLTLRNIERPIQAFRVGWDASDWMPSALPAASSPELASLSVPLTLPDKPSIAVLPFENMSADPEQAFFADGLVEDIITALSRFKSLFVIARNSSFTYKGRAVDVKQVGHELGVRYVLEGSVRKAGGRVRVTGQLIESQTGAHVWADRFERDVEDVFELQDQVTTCVIGQIAPKIEQAEIERLRIKPAQSPSAYESYLRGMASFYRSTRDSMSEALTHFYRAIELDPDFAPAYVGAALAYTRRRQSQWMVDVARECAEGVRLGRRAAELQSDDANALGVAGFALAYLGGEINAGIAFTDRALRLNPNSSLIWHGSGWIKCYAGDPDTAIEHLAKAARLSPLDPQMGQIQLATALALSLAQRYEESASWAEKVLQDQPDLVPALIRYAASSALADRVNDAQRAMSRAMRIDPKIRISNYALMSLLRRPADLARLSQGLRLAGMPE